MDEHKRRHEELTEQLTEKLSDILLGEERHRSCGRWPHRRDYRPCEPQDHQNFASQTGRDNYSNIEIDPSPVRNKILDIVASYEQKFADVDMERERQLDRIESGMKPIRVSSSR